MSVGLELQDLCFYYFFTFTALSPAQNSSFKDSLKAVFGGFGFVGVCLLWIRLFCQIVDLVVVWVLGMCRNARF